MTAVTPFAPIVHSDATRRERSLRSVVGNTHVKERPEVNEPRTTIVLIDPSAADGEAAIDLLKDQDSAVAVVVPIAGAPASSLREYAEAEEIDFGLATDLYLGQLAERMESANRSVDIFPTEGLDVVAGLVSFARGYSVDRILVPGSMSRQRGFSVDRLVSETSVPILVAPSGPRTVTRTRWPWRAA
jgi:hypothetical protein